MSEKASDYALGPASLVLKPCVDACRVADHVEAREKIWSFSEDMIEAAWRINDQIRRTPIGGALLPIDDLSSPLLRDGHKAARER